MLCTPSRSRSHESCDGRLMVCSSPVPVNGALPCHLWAALCPPVPALPPLPSLKDPGLPLLDWSLVPPASWLLAGSLCIAMAMGCGRPRHASFAPAPSLCRAGCPWRREKPGSRGAGQAHGTHSALPPTEGTGASEPPWRRAPHHPRNTSSPIVTHPEGPRERQAPVAGGEAAGPGQVWTRAGSGAEEPSAVGCAGNEANTRSPLHPSLPESPPSCQPQGASLSTGGRQPPPAPAPLQRGIASWSWDLVQPLQTLWVPHCPPMASPARQRGRLEPASTHRGLGTGPQVPQCR